MLLGCPSSHTALSLQGHRSLLAEKLHPCLAHRRGTVLLTAQLIMIG